MRTGSALVMLSSGVLLKFSLTCVDWVVLCIFSSQLEVEDPRQRKINLGSLNSGRKVKRKVKVVNRSCIDVSFKLLLNTQLDQRVRNVCVGVHVSLDTHTHTHRP